MAAIDAHHLLAEIASGDRERKLEATNIISAFDGCSDVDESIFVASLFSPNEDVVFWSEIALGHLRERGREAIPILISLLRNDQLFLRQTAVKTLAAVGPNDKKARDAVFSSFADESPFVRREALQASIGLPNLTLDQLKTIAAMASDPDEAVSRWSEIALRNIRLRDSGEPKDELSKLEEEADLTRQRLHG